MGVKSAALLLVALSSVIGACSTAAQRQLASINTKGAEATAANKACMAEIAAKPEYAGIAKHLPLDGSPASLEQKADQAFVTPQEAKAVLAWRNEFGQCRQARDGAVQAFAPAAMPAILEAENASDAVWVKVVHREMSWGTAIQQLADISASTQAKGQQIAKEMTAELNQEHQAELAQRREVANAFAQAAQNFQQQQNQQQMINALNRPRTTNCSAFGNSASCTTY
ncbi:hypothetical protein SAMN05444161_6881 [Rhizobiales bacterium GAS191]|nr:hypothetical protein SAMN05444161_6881 [Rhizobiales bacterium GAS191]